MHAGRALAGCLLGLAVLVATVAPAAAQIEDYATYQPQTRCSPEPKAGTKALASWLVKRGGGEGPFSRPCNSGGTSEHKEGRAFDWILDATREKDRLIARAFLDDAFETDRRGHDHARARRMGIMYIIWNDHMYRSYSEFAKDDYLSGGCKSRKTCSKTARHRDHMHISLSRKGGRGETSWYDGRLTPG